MISIQRAEIAAVSEDPHVQTEAEAEWALAKADGRFEALLHGVFDVQNNVNEGGDKAFYAEIIRAVVGLPLRTVDG